MSMSVSVAGGSMIGPTPTRGSRAWDRSRVVGGGQSRVRRLWAHALTITFTDQHSSQVSMCALSAVIMDLSVKCGCWVICRSVRQSSQSGRDDSG
jgi:hypothetical protein